MYITPCTPSLPCPKLQAFALKGMHMMYPWQSAALEEGWHGDNLVYSAPTSGGKSLVADLLLIKALGQLRLVRSSRRLRAM